MAKLRTKVVTVITLAAISFSLAGCQMDESFSSNDSTTLFSGHLPSEKKRHASDWAEPVGGFFLSAFLQAMFDGACQ